MDLKFPQSLNIKIFEFDNRKYVLDIYTSAFLEIDNITYDFLKRTGRMDRDSLGRFLSFKYGEEKAIEVFGQFAHLKNRGILLSGEEEPVQKFVPPDMYYLSSLSVNLTHDCNLRCKYCYGGEGNYGLPRDYMDISTAEDVAETLVKSSGNRKMVSVLFFGGEPLMNFEVLKYFVLFTNDLLKDKDKKINYTVITNGTLLTDNIIDFLNEHNIGVQISLDGPKEIQDYARPAAGNRSSYDILEKKVKNFTASRGRRGSVRVSVSHHNLDLLGSLKFFLDMGFNHIHFEPITATEESEFYLTSQDLRVLEKEYEKLAEFYYKELKKGRFFGLEGFTNAMSSTYDGEQKFYGCGVGRTFMAVTPKGDIYPCHRFQGMKDWKMGSIYRGVDEGMRKIFLHTFAENIEDCAKCWARYYCGGGCIVESFIYNGTIYKPPKWHCDLRRLELKLGLEIYSALSREDRETLDYLYG